ncbi:MAG: serine hydrolase domain-containing protein [Desulfarculaceae bacterium]
MPESQDLAQRFEQGAAQGVAPALVLLLWRDGAPQRLLCAGEAEENTVFDLASLTKPLAAAPLALDLAAEGVLPWTATLADIWGEAVPEDKQGITIERLLTHSAGFPAHRPYFTVLEKQPMPARQGLLKAMLMNEPLEYQPGEKALYSDLGYMLLGLILEETGGQRLNAALKRMYERLGIQGPKFLPLDEPPPWPRDRIAACGSLPGRENILGQVEDENAFALGGVAGHAGLFGTAGQAAQVMEALTRTAAGGGPWPVELASRLWKRDRHTPKSTRTPGFDTPSGAMSAAGESPPLDVIGHTGFTGTSLWWHPPSGRGVVLLTNRVAFGRDNQKIAAFRHQVHNLAWPALGL